MDRTELSGDGMYNSVVSGLVITFNRAPGVCERLCAELRSHGAIQIGAVKECWIAVAVEARDDGESHDIHDWIASREGVEYVDLVSFSFDPAMNLETQPELATR